MTLNGDVEEVRTRRGVPGRGGEGTGRDEGRQYILVQWMNEWRDPWF